jgi:hypothetical protein
MNAIVQGSDGALTQQPYTGPSGRTRVERACVFRPGRKPAALEVFRVLNVEECPGLREAALNGCLHQLEDGEEVEVPFIYHDPRVFRFALVIPNGARCRELSERARLLDSLMQEHEEDVPDYVRNFAIVHGSRGLARYVSDADRIEVELSELEPVDGRPVVASYDPRLSGLLPPAGFWTHASTELAPLLDDDELWLFVRVEKDEPEAFSEASSDLLIQLKTVEQVPVCVLALTDSRAGAVRRAYLNPARSADGRILECLRRDFRATVVVHSEQRRPLRSFRVEAPRAANVKLIIGRTELAPQPSRDRWESCVDACRSAPPPVSQIANPFGLSEDASTAAEALDRLRLLEAWSSPARVEEALSILSTPRTLFELSRRRIVADALRFGLAMSDALVPQAVQFGFASEAKDLVLALGRQFEQIVPQASAQGLDEGQVRANRRALERLAMMHGTSTELALSCTM